MTIQVTMNNIKQVSEIPFIGGQYEQMKIVVKPLYLQVDDEPMYMIWQK